MSYQPETTQPQAGAGQPAPTGPIDTALLDALIAHGLAAAPPEWQQNQPQPESALEAYPPQPQADPNAAPPLYGETPGEGYIYAHAPQQRQAAMVQTTPELVRDMLLRAIEVASQNALLPFSEQPPGQWGDLMLRAAQAYLLLDPSVDQNGVPVGAQAHEQALANAGEPRHQAQTEQAQAAATQALAGAHQAFTQAQAVGAFKPPPRVAPNPAERKVEERNRGKTEVLRGVRADQPRPKPRVGS